MQKEKAIILDNILLELHDNKGLNWKDLQKGKLNHIAPYELIETNINSLVADGMLKRDKLETDYLTLTDKGFSTMREIKEFGYVHKAHKAKMNLIWQRIIEGVTIATLGFIVYTYFYPRQVFPHQASYDSTLIQTNQRYEQQPTSTQLSNKPNSSVLKADTLAK